MRVLFFAAVRDLVGQDEVTLALPDGTRTIGLLARFLEEELPALRGALGQVRFARNHAFAEPGDELAADDEIALIPPVQGG